MSDIIARGMAGKALKEIADIESGGGGEPDAYIKSASVSGNTLTITNKDDTTVTFTPSGGITEERVNELIDTKLNAIPNAEGGAY